MIASYILSFCMIYYDNCNLRCSYWYLDDYKTEFVSDNWEEKFIEKEPE